MEKITITNNWCNLIYNVGEKRIKVSDIKKVKIEGKIFEVRREEKYESYTDHGFRDTVKQDRLAIKIFRNTYIDITDKIMYKELDVYVVE